MKQIEPTGNDLLNDAHIFAQHIVAALDCLEECLAMDRIFSAPGGNDLFRKAPHFYCTAYFAMLYRFYMEMAKLFDEDSLAKKFPQFKNDARRGNFIGGQTDDEYKQAYRVAEKDLRAIGVRRDKIYAHSDAEWFNNPEIFLNEHPVNYIPLKKLLQVMLSICNRVIWHETTEGRASLYSTYNNDDFVKLHGDETWYEKDIKTWTSK